MRSSPGRYAKGYADEHFLSDYRYQFPREDPALPEVFVYTEKMSYDPGEAVEFHGSTTARTWSIQIYRDGHKPQMMDEAFELPGSFTKTSETAFMDGCDWPVLYRWKIPDDARSGFTVSYRPACVPTASVSFNTISSWCAPPGKPAPGVSF